MRKEGNQRNICKEINIPRTECLFKWIMEENIWKKHKGMPNREMRPYDHSVLLLRKSPPWIFWRIWHQILFFFSFFFNLKWMARNLMMPLTESKNHIDFISGSWFPPPGSYLWIWKQRAFCFNILYAFLSEEIFRINSLHLTTTETVWCDLLILQGNTGSWIATPNSIPTTS